LADPVWVGGLTPIIVAIIAMFVLPESIKFLSLKRERHGKLVRQIERMQPGLNLDPNSDFVIGGERLVTARSDALPGSSDVLPLDHLNHLHSSIKLRSRLSDLRCSPDDEVGIGSR